MIEKNLQLLREMMKKDDVQAYIIPTADYHHSEYVGDYFKARAFMTGFTGSVGTLIVTQEEACLWVDGRYFIQADKQVYNTSIKVMKMGLPGVPTTKEYIEKQIDPLQQSITIGFDGRLLAAKEVLSLLSLPIHVHLCDYISSLWVDRPTLSCEPGFLYDLKYCGESRTAKIARVREKMENSKYHIITTLDDIAWLFNIRGKDVHCNPVVLAYAMITPDQAYLYVQNGTFNASDITVLKQDGVTIKEYSEIYEDIKQISDTVMLDSQTVNYTIYQSIHAPIIDRYNPSQQFKAIKNDIEIENTIQAHIKDGVAVTKFMYWLKNNITKIPMDEVSVANVLQKLREEQPLFYDLSFETICAYKENAAQMHYQATPENHKKLQPEGLLLIDSGGQYLDGTTDITRTFALGPISEEESRDFTITLRAFLRLQNAIFLEGTNGVTLDQLARGMAYQYHLDYRCGTGHGVGHFLNVHEGPNGFRPVNRPNARPISNQMPGMVTTDEPGVYKEGKHGIRLENELLCVLDEKNEYGQFLSFQPLTMCPIDKDAIDYTMLTDEEVDQLNAYHQLVATTLAPYLTEAENEWLQKII